MTCPISRKINLPHLRNLSTDKGAFSMQIHSFPLQSDALDAAVAALRAGTLVVVATETVFGVVADASNADAVAALYAAKGRAATVPLQILVPDAAAACAIGQWNGMADRLAQAFWPGPLTLVVPLLAEAEAMIAENVLAGGETIGIRVPNHPSVQALLAVFGAPLAASSANRSGEPPAHNAAEAVAALGVAVACVLDGPCDANAQASTVVDVTRTPPQVLRQGGCDVAAIIG